MKKLSFQDLIISLQTYWAKHGCLLWNPYHEAVGAGTGNPATLLRVLGPEPWNVAYVEPSFRPDDGRFAENPNRMQMHHQYQVILKPIPENAQELYLGSLFNLGLNLKDHDFRFVEDNWESPALGAWGLGWEVWLDGMEITQFTYFQQAGGITLDPPACEITYGLERIAMYLQDVNSVWDLTWNGDVSYADILKHQEVEYCKYDFLEADVTRLKEMYRLFFDEARLNLDRGLAIPAYDYVLRCSHTFNILDSRGAVGLAERVKCFGEMRGMTRAVAELFVKQRNEQSYPLLKQPYSRHLSPLPMPEVPSNQPKDFLFELGVEELASGVTLPLKEQLESKFKEKLIESRLSFETIKSYVTPRRLVVEVTALAARQPELVEEARGPKKDVADKNPKALEGFCQRCGISPAEIEYREENGAVYAFAKVKRPSNTAPQVLSEIIPSILSSLQSTRNMRWLPSTVTGGNTAFNRPIRTIVAIYGDQPVPVSFGGITSGTITRGNRFEGSQELTVGSSTGYKELLRKHNILLDEKERRTTIKEQLLKSAANLGAEAKISEDLLDEVTQLVEYPTTFVGQFKAEFLDLPDVVIAGIMEHHLRCFPLYKNQKIMSQFLSVRNGLDEGIESVKKGYERVLSARLSDARFFVSQDNGMTLDQFREGLHKLTFHQKLGSMFEKTERLAQLAPEIVTLAALDLNVPALTRAATISKADLASSMVTEMTSLAGLMGRIYGERTGEDRTVTTAIAEHYYPKAQGDRLAGTIEGRVLAIADRLDNLASFFSLGLEPTGTADPFGLRREAIALLVTLIDGEIELDLNTALSLAWKLIPKVKDSVPENDGKAKLLEFLAKRLEGILRDRGHRYDYVRAVLASSAHKPALAKRLVAGLEEASRSSGFEPVLTAYLRCKNIVRSAKDKSYEVSLTPDPKLLSEPEEKALLAEVTRIRSGIPNGSFDFQKFVSVLTPAVGPVHTFFDKVLVMAEDKQVRASRLSLVNQLVELVEPYAQLDLIEQVNQ